MLSLTLKSIRANKIRFFLTGVAVILGVAFMSGTFVLTDTIKQSYDNLSTNVYKHTDAVVRRRLRPSGRRWDGEHAARIRTAGSSPSLYATGAACRAQAVTANEMRDSKPLLEIPRKIRVVRSPDLLADFLEG